jgi:Tol biopolymer transport system component/DNA-binding winged helix-turn-helix (wHTH) protein
VDLRSGELRKGGLKIKLQEQPFQILTMLLERPGEIITREEIEKKLWSADTFVDFEHSLATAVKKLREALGDSADNPRFIETLPRRGYRFIAPVDVGAVHESPLRRRWPVVATAGALLFAGLAVLLGLNVASLRDRLFPKPPPELKQRRLTTNSSENPVFSGAISADGKYLAYSDSAGIHLKLIETGEERLLPKPSGVTSDAAWNVWDWFPDGTRLLATLWEAGDHPSVWVVSVLAENARRLRDDAIGWSVSPDGSHIAYTCGTGQNYAREIWVMSPQGKSPERVLGLDENDEAYFVQWSPDGRRVAYCKRHPAPERVECSIETCTLKGAERTAVVADPLLSSFCWIPQGYIVYSRLESQWAVDSNLWKVPVDSRTGKPEGGPTRVTNWAGFQIDSLKASADGMRISYAKTPYQVHAYVGELEAGGTRMKPPQRLTSGEATDFPRTWTGDGKFVLFMSDRSGSWGLYKQAIGGGTAQLLVTANVLRASLSPDGSWVLYFVVGPERGGSSTPVPVMRMPVLGGPSQMVLEVKNMSGLRCARAPATFCVVGEMSPDNKLLTITGFDPLKGRGPVLKTIQTDPTVGYTWDLAPDGSKLAVYKAGEAEAHVRLLSLNGGKDREITVKGWGGLQTMDWSHDGKVLYCGSVSPEAATLLRIDMQGRAQVLWRQKGTNQTYGIPSPDGRRLAIMGYITNSNQWMVEGF